MNIKENLIKIAIGAALLAALFWLCLQLDEPRKVKAGTNVVVEACGQAVPLLKVGDSITFTPCTKAKAASQ